MTIYDIAAEAGVSIATVSRVLNNPGRVSVGTRKRVEDVVRKYRFAPNAIARAIQSDGRKNIVLFSNNIRHPHFASTAYVLDEMFFRLGYNSLVCSTGNDAEKRKEQFRALASQQIDGLAFLGSTFVGIGVEELINTYFHEIPVVISNGVLSLPNARSVMIDHIYGMEQVIAHLVERGHSRIVSVHCELTFNAERKRKAFRNAMERHGLSVSDGQIMCTSAGVGGGAPFARRFVQEKMDCSAVVFADDLPAVAAITQLHYFGVRVPDDLAVVGYDNSAYCTCCYPALTSVDTKSEALANVLGNTLHELMNGRDVGSTIMLRPELVVRESS